uniref:Root-preferentially expressed cytochrome P450 CYP-117747 n=1 Tax=Atropa belladonna TaxID=33113 RepID=A0A3G4RHX2_ATRBE|nr:root-preferentially expressed cytochrome P450 CYP-117747 [Atropa belladonna]
METMYQINPFFFAVIILSIGAWNVLNWVWLRPKRLEKCLRRQGFRGNDYRLFYGDKKDMSKMIKEARNSKPISISDDILPRVIPHIFQTVKKYGKNAIFWHGTTPEVYIMDPLLIKEIFSKNYDFQKPHNPLAKLLAQGLVGAEGGRWAKNRRIMNPAFHPDKLKNMLPAFYLSCSELVNRWDEVLSQQDTQEVDIWPSIQNLSTDIIARSAFGVSYKQGRDIFELQKEQAYHLMEIVRSGLYIPGWRFLPTKRNRRMKDIEKKIQETIRGIIDDRFKAMKTGHASNNDLLGSLLESSSENGQPGKRNSVMNIADIVEECKLFFFAGSENTSVTIVWTMFLLSIHEDWQTRAREEVLRAFGHDKPNFDGLNHLKIVNMILHEVLRLYPPVTSINRKIYKETKLGDMSLPAGVLLLLPTILLHHDRELWGDDAREFKPERFSEGISGATKGKVSFFPYGLGPRICIGQNFALLEVKMAISMILQRFSFELSTAYVHTPHKIVALQPQDGVNLILNRL